MKESGFNEKDWRIYKSKIANWQESYMEKLCHEYVELLTSEKLPSERFWGLVDRIKADRYRTGVVAENARSAMMQNILDLLNDGAITLDDLSDFSIELQEKIRFIYTGGYNNPHNLKRYHGET